MTESFGYIANTTFSAGRPTFYFKNNLKLPIRAAGVLPFKRDGDNIKFLMIKRRNRHEDFGGKTDMIDKCIEETAVREAYEESNGIFDKETIIRQLYYTVLPKTNVAYSKMSKYIVFFVEVTEDYDCDVFGDREIHDDIDRTVEWVDIGCFLDDDFLDRLHCRLKFNYFFYCLRKL